MMNKAKKLVKDYYNSHVDVTDNVVLIEDDVYIVWFSKTLQNWKALVSTNVSDGMYYEVTYNGDSKETYVDVYKKWDNKCIPDAQELVHFLKAGSPTAKLERQILEKQRELLVAKTSAIESQKRVEELYSNALSAMRAYSGDSEKEDDIYD